MSTTPEVTDAMVRAASAAYCFDADNRPHSARMRSAIEAVMASITPAPVTTPAPMSTTTQGWTPRKLCEWDTIAALIDPDAFDDDIDASLVERRCVAREKVRLIENALVGFGWTTNVPHSAAPPAPASPPLPPRASTTSEAERLREIIRKIRAKFHHSDWSQDGLAMDDDGYVVITGLCAEAENVSHSAATPAPSSAPPEGQAAESSAPLVSVILERDRLRAALTRISVSHTCTVESIVEFAVSALDPDSEDEVGLTDTLSPEDQTERDRKTWAAAIEAAAKLCAEEYARRHADDLSVNGFCYEPTMEGVAAAQWKNAADRIRKLIGGG